MFNLKIALRQLRQQRAYSLINIVGLGVSIGCCILIFRFVHAQLSVDTFHQHADRISRNLLAVDSIQEFLVNEKLVKKLNLASAEDFLGKSLNLGGTEGQVVGVLRDFHHESFQSAIPPITI